MHEPVNAVVKQAMLVMTAGLVAATPALAQNRVAVPAGSVIMVRTNEALNSGTAKVGQTFETTVVDLLSVEGYAVIPSGSRIRGVVSYVQPATRQRSGVIQITFDRLTIPNGSSVAIAGRLTSTDSTERRQIDAREDQRVVLVGGRGGIGAAIAGAGSNSSSTGNILGALGAMLSEGTNVNVPANTQLAVQLDRAVTLTRRGSANASDPSTIYTATQFIRAAQQALARQAYYRGTPNGSLDNATRRALFEFQIDNNITPTGNLDRRTAIALGLPVDGGTTTSTARAVLTARDASLLRRAAQAVQSQQRQAIGISTSGQLSTNRTYAETDFELLFALSAFADNASLYEQVVTAGSANESLAIAGGALISAARRVDSAMQQARPTTQVQSNWRTIRQQLTRLDRNYR